MSSEAEPISDAETRWALDPDMRRALEFDASFRAQSGYSTLDEAGRQDVDEELARHWNTDCPPMDKVIRQVISVYGSPIELRTHVPPNDDGRACVIWVHGGGWRSSSLDQNDRLMRVVAVSAGAPVVGIGYSKAPARRFPAQIEQVYAACRHVFEAALPDRSIRSIAGFSAGANLVLATMAKCSDRLSAGAFDRAGLVCGVYADDFDTESYTTYATSGLGRSRSSMIDIIEDYAPGAIQRRDPFVFPVDADQTVCSEFLIMAAEHDMLRDDSRALAASLSNKGHNVLYEEVPGVTHLFVQRSRWVKAAEHALDRLGRFLTDRQPINQSSEVRTYAARDDDRRSDRQGSNT